MKQQLLIGILKTLNKPTHFASTLPNLDQSFVKELAKSTQDKIVFIKFPMLLKKIKNSNTQPTLNHKETQYDYWQNC
jgi:hypothetical protein